MNIHISSSKKLKKTLEYNFLKWDMTIKDLKNQDTKKFEELVEANKLPRHNLALLLDHNLPLNFDNKKYNQVLSKIIK